MFQRFHAMKERREGGFTLIELLVVILIIAILAAIAIPVFLQQRRKGWIAQVQSGLKNAATAQESFLTDPANNTYATTEALLNAEGLRVSGSDVNFADADIAINGALGYCMKMTSAKDASIVFYYHSADGRPLDAGYTNVGPVCP